MLIVSFSYFCDCADSYFVGQFWHCIREPSERQNSSRNASLHFLIFFCHQVLNHKGLFSNYLRYLVQPAGLPSTQNWELLKSGKLRKDDYLCEVLHEKKVNRDFSCFPKYRLTNLIQYCICNEILFCHQFEFLSSIIESTTRFSLINFALILSQLRTSN